MACIGIRSDTGTARTVTVTMGSGSTTRTVGLLTLGSQDPIIVQDSGVTRSSAETDIAITVTTSGAILIESCAVYELPRASLSRDATDGGIALDTLFPRRPIMDSGAQSVRGVAKLMQAIDGRRIGHIARWGEEIATTSAAFGTVLFTPYRVVPRYDVSGFRNVTIALRGRGTVGGTTGEFRAVAGSGATATGTITGTVSAWQAAVTLALKCEDPATANGLAGGVYDTIDVQLRRTAGAGSIVAESWGGYELT